MNDEIDSGSIAVMKALWLQNRNQEESTYNKLFKLTNKFRSMARQTFDNKLKMLMNIKYVNQSTKEESKLHFKPSVYTLSKKGLQVISHIDALIGYKQKQVEEANEMTQEEIYRRLYKMTLLATSSAPIFILLGHENFIMTYIYDMAITWIGIMKKRMHADMEEAVNTVLPIALALTVEISREPLSDSLIEDIKGCIRQWNLEPEEVFDKSEKLRGELKEWISYLEN